MEEGYKGGGRRFRAKIRSTPQSIARKAEGDVEEDLARKGRQKRCAAAES